MIDWAEETGIRRTAIRVIFAGAGYGRRLNRKRIWNFLSELCII